MPTILEENKRLSESILWQLQRNFYDEKGVQAWHGVVPWFITNNNFIATSFAKVMVAYVRDCMASQTLDPSQPIHIIELGAGAGRFAYLCLKALRELWPAGAPPLHYVLTDFAQRNVKFWASHPNFAPYVAEGIVDFARFDAENDKTLTLVQSKQELTAANLPNPTIVVANYLFDTIVQDAFRVENGALMESLVTVLVEEKPEDPAYFPTIADVSVRYAYQPVPNGYYPEPEFNEILHGYAERLGDTAVSFPIGAFRCIQNLLALTHDNLLVLTADKGYNNEADLLYQRDPEPVQHGSFSLSVNFHAIGQYFRQRGGVAWHTVPRETSLAISAFMGRGQTADYPTAQHAFNEYIEAFGPIDFFSLQDYPINPDTPPPLPHLLALLRLSHYDPYYFYTLSNAIAEQLEDGLTNRLEADFIRTLERVWDNHYPMGESRDVAFEIGRHFYKLQRHSRARTFYEESLRFYGEHHITYYNLGLCLYKLGLRPEALTAFQKALELDESYSPARSWRVRVEGEL